MNALINRLILVLYKIHQLLGVINHLMVLRPPRSAEFFIRKLFIQNISPLLKEFHHFTLCFSSHQNNTTLAPGFLGQQFNNLQRAAFLTSFWHPWFNKFQRVALLTSLVQYLVNSSWLWWIMSVVLTNQKQKYFEWIMIIIHICFRCRESSWWTSS